MKKLLIGLIMLITLSVSGQCKYEVNKVDEFEKVNIKVTEETKVTLFFARFPITWFSLCKADTTYSIRLRFSFPKMTCFNEKSELLLLTSEKEVFRLKQSKLFDCTKAKSGAYFGTLFFEISKADLFRLQSMKLEKYRLLTTEGSIDVDMIKGNTLKDNAVNYFKNFAKCIIE
jgi:hypothetical protein